MFLDLVGELVDQSLLHADLCARLRDLFLARPGDGQLVCRLGLLKVLFGCDRRRDRFVRDFPRKPPNCFETASQPVRVEPAGSSSAASAPNILASARWISSGRVPFSSSASCCWRKSSSASRPSNSKVIVSVSNFANGWPPFDPIALFEQHFDHAAVDRRADDRLLVRQDRAHEGLAGRHLALDHRRNDDRRDDTWRLARAMPLELTKSYPIIPLTR